jgi:hypothetical protein
MLRDTILGTKSNYRHHEDHAKMNTMSKDTFQKINSYDYCHMEIQDVEPLDLANFPEMTEEELDHTHDIFMLTADNGHSEMKPV